MYSNAKAQLTLEKQQAVTDEALQQIRKSLNPDEAKVLAYLIDKLHPLIQERVIAQQQEAMTKAAIDYDLSNLSFSIKENNDKLTKLVSRLDSLEQLKTVNVEKEKQVLDKLLAASF